MLGVSPRARNRKGEIRRRIRNTVIAKLIGSFNWKEATHIAQRTDGCWDGKVREWRLRICKRSIGRSTHKVDGCPG